MGLGLILFVFSVSISVSPTGGLDPLDTNANVTIQWDIVDLNPDTYTAWVTIHNYQKYRHIETPPGWHLTWEWQNNEVIWDMRGAEAKEQGQCNSTDGVHLPHCCLRNPVIIDLQSGTPFNKQFKNCCRAGALSSMTQDLANSIAAFSMSVGFNGFFVVPVNFKFLSDGYTCDVAKEVPATKYPVDEGRRWTQAFKTIRITCMYSQFRATPVPTCCVSLSAFYSQTIVTCPNCTCGCRGQPGSHCLKRGETPPVLEKPKDPDEVPPQLVNCTNHMCPIHVHWHVKQSYREYWRVKITVMNLNVRKNYSEWNLAILHPNLDSLVQVFSFNYKSLSYGTKNDTGLFWGIKYYNDMLLQAGQSGNVQSELILRKVPGQFTFEGGWSFPRRVYFNGHDCVLPPPHQFPRLPTETRGSRW